MVIEDEDFYISMKALNWLAILPEEGQQCLLDYKDPMVEYVTLFEEAYVGIVGWVSGIDTAYESLNGNDISLENQDQDEVNATNTQHNHPTLSPHYKIILDA